MILALGTISILAGLLIPGTDSAWNAMVTNLGNQAFPTFDNPFGGHQTFAERRTPVGNGNKSTPTLVAPAGSVGCANATWWGCVQYDDGNLSYTIQNYSKAGYNVKFSNSTQSYDVIDSVTITMVCSTNNTGTDLNTISFFIEVDRNVFVPSGGAASLSDQTQRCPRYPQFGAISISMAQVPGYGLAWSETGGNINTDWEIVVLVGGSVTYPGDEVFVTAIYADVIFETKPPCTGDWFANTGCQIGRFFDGFIKGIQFLMNGIIFIGQALFYVISVLAIIVLGLFSIFAFLFAIPGTPQTIQAIIDIGLAAMIVFVLLYVVGKVRGTGNVA